MFKPRFFLSLTLVALVAFAAMRTSDPGSAASSQTIEGVFTIINIDPPPVRGAAEFYFITTDAGDKFPLVVNRGAFSQHTPAELNRRLVSVTGQGAVLNGDRVFIADSISLVISANKLGGAPVAGPTGSQKWLILLCRFSDLSGVSSPSLAQVDALQGDNTGLYPGLDNYYRQVSYNQINLVGSQVQNWLTLPKTKSQYLGSDGQLGGGEFDTLANDCMNLHDSNVIFPDFSVITVMVNSDLGCCGYGGSFNMTRDGVNKTYGFTWVPGLISGTVYLDQSFNGHELGHALGLPHSYGPGSGAPYDSQWDIMSDCNPSNQGGSGSPYYCYGPGTIAFHKDLLGWIPSANKLNVPTNVISTIDMYPLGDGIPASDTYLMAQVNWPATGTANCLSSADPSKCFLTIEVRRRAALGEQNYDQNVPGSGVVLHRVDQYWDFQHGQAKVVDTDGNNNGNDSGAIFTVGESYTDPVTSIKIEVLQTVGTGGFRIRFTPPGAPPPPDTTQPTVQSVTSTLANGTYGVGTTVPVRITFSENVIVTGTPQLLLETGATNRQANYASGSGSTNLTFNYVVQAGDSSSDLDYVSSSSLTLNGGVIGDATTNNAVLTLANPGASNSLGANKAIVINTAPPPITTTTWRNCGANAAVTASGNGDRNGFTSGSAACTDGGSYATDTNSGSGTSTSCTSSQKDRHLFYNYGLPSIPVGQTIKGIEVRLDAWADSSSSSPRMCVQLSWNGGLSWTTAKQTSSLSTSQATRTLGSASDTWGHSWTSSQLSNANFRVRITDVSSSTSRDFRLDWAAVRITYGP